MNYLELYESMSNSYSIALLSIYIRIAFHVSLVISVPNSSTQAFLNLPSDYTTGACKDEYGEEIGLLLLGSWQTTLWSMVCSGIFSEWSPYFLFESM